MRHVIISFFFFQGLDRVVKSKFEAYHLEARRQIFQAISFEATIWYTCPCGTVYAVGDCGHLNEVSRCPDCKRRIGNGSGNTQVSGVHQPPPQLALGAQLPPLPEFWRSKSRASIDLYLYIFSYGRRGSVQGNPSPCLPVSMNLLYFFAFVPGSELLWVVISLLLEC